MVRAPSVILFLLLVSSLAAADTQFSTYLGGQWGEFASAVATDSAGNVYVTGLTASPDFPVTRGAAQTTYGGANDAFIAKFSPAGTLLWCTYFGGSAGELANGIAVDSAGNAIVIGTTTSTDLPVVNAAQPSLDNNHLKYYRDAFVVKVSADGSRFLYATYLGGEGSDFGWAVAVDPAGNAYVAGDTESYGFFPGPDGPSPHQQTYNVTYLVKLSPEGKLAYTAFVDHITVRGMALDRAGDIYLTGATPNGQATRAAVSKVKADGSGEIYRASLGGSLFDMGASIAVDSSGSAWITGVTASGDFPVVRAIQPRFGARPLWKSTDSTATWNPIDNAPFGQISAMFSASGALYVAAFDSGLWTTSDGGATWSNVTNGLSGRIQALQRDPSTGVLYAGTSTGIFKSTDQAQTWTAASNGLPASNASVSALAADPLHAGTLYAAISAGPVYKSTDGGDSWKPVPALTTACGNCSEALAVDPANGDVYASAVIPFTFPGFFGISPPPPPKNTLFRSVDGGASWAAASNIFSTFTGFVIDSSSQPSTIYAGLVARSDDGGQTWTPIRGPVGGPMGVTPTLDPATGALYVALGSPSVAVFVSYDHAATWQPAPGMPFSGPQGSVPAIGALVVDTASPGTFYISANSFHTDAFVAQLSPDGSTLLFSTYLGGHQVTDFNLATGGGYVQSSLYIAASDTYGQGIAIDSDGNVVVTGGTRVQDFPTRSAAQPANANFLDAFVTVISPDGGSLLYSSYFGGGYSDAARAVAIDPQGAVVIVGQTHSDNFPIVNAAQPIKRNVDDAFVTKLTWR